MKTLLKLGPLVIYVTRPGPYEASAWRLRGDGKREHVMCMPIRSLPHQAVQDAERLRLLHPRLHTHVVNTRTGQRFYEHGPR